MIPLERALAIADEKIGDQRLSSESVPVREAVNRILSADQYAKVDLPPFDKAAVDGYAVLANDHRETYRLVGTVAAGQPGIDTLAPGTTLYVMTGAPLPPGTGKVIMHEQAIETDGLVRFENPDPASNVCRKAEDISVGDVILKTGSRLGPLEIANLIGCGITEVDVARRLTVAIVTTGDEIVNSIDRLGPGKIMNTNGPLTRNLCRRYALEVAREEMIPDDPAELSAALKRALAEADMVLVSGGVSEGAYDYVPRAISECGLQIHFSRVAVKPGKPTTFATGKGRILFGLPGNPVAVYLMFHLFVLRAVSQLCGGTYHPRAFKMRMACDFTRRSALRTEYHPCRISAEGLAEPIDYHGSAHLVALMQADGFFIIPQGVQSLSAGVEVTFVQFEGARS